MAKPRRDVAQARGLILELLRDEPRCIAELAVEIGRSITMTTRHINAMHVPPDGSEKLIYISGWFRQIGIRGRWGAIYSVGNAKDKKAPNSEQAQKEAKARHAIKFKGLYKARAQAKRGTATIFSMLM